MDMEACASVVSACLPGAGLLPLFRIPPQDGQSTIWHLVTGTAMGRSDPHAVVHGEGQTGPRRVASHAANVRRGCQGDCQLLGSSPRASGTDPLPQVASRGVSVG